MELKLIRTNLDYIVMVRTTLTEEMVNVVSEEAKQLKDKDGNVQFVLDWTEDGDGSLKEHGVILPGQSFSINVQYHNEEEVKYAKMHLAKIKERATKVEKQIKKEYEALVVASESIEVEEF